MKIVQNIAFLLLCITVLGAAVIALTGCAETARVNRDTANVFTPAPTTPGGGD